MEGGVGISCRTRLLPSCHTDTSVVVALVITCSLAAIHTGGCRLGRIHVFRNPPGTPYLSTVCMSRARTLAGEYVVCEEQVDFIPVLCIKTRRLFPKIPFPHADSTSKE